MKADNKGGNGMALTQSAVLQSQENDPEQIIARVQRGERVLCAICGALLVWLKEQPNPVEVRCPNGHEQYLLVWDPAPPALKTSDQETHCVWLEPVKELSPAQLKYLRDLLAFHELSLTQVRARLVDGERHLLVNNEPAPYVRELTEQLSNLNISYVVE